MTKTTYAIDNGVSTQQAAVSKKKIYIRHDTKFKMLNLNELTWIYAKKNYCTFFMEDGKEYTMRVSLKSLEETLPLNDLVRCHRNYIVNSCKIDVYDPNGYVEIANTQIPMGKRYRQNIEGKLHLLG